MNNGDFKSEAVAVIDSFARGAVSLPRLASRLEQLLEAAEDVPEDWKDRFFAQWMVVEEVNAVRLDRGGRPADYDEDGILSGAINALAALLAELQS